MFSKELIRLASDERIQKMLTPEVGMWCVYAPTYGIKKFNATRDLQLISRVGRWSKQNKEVWIHGDGFSQARYQAILLPSLELLIEKLGCRGILMWDDSWDKKYQACHYQYVRTWQNQDANERADTAPLAALKALRRVMGIEEKENEK